MDLLSISAEPTYMNQMQNNNQKNNLSQLQLWVQSQQDRRRDVSV
jgi:hypothetical protein